MQDIKFFVLLSFALGIVFGLAYCAKAVQMDIICKELYMQDQTIQLESCKDVELEFTKEEIQQLKGKK